MFLGFRTARIGEKNDMWLNGNAIPHKEIYILFSLNSNGNLKDRSQAFSFGIPMNYWDNKSIHQTHGISNWPKRLTRNNLDHATFSWLLAWTRKELKSNKGNKSYRPISSSPCGLRLWMLYTRQRLFNSRQQHICRKFFNNFWYVTQLIEFVCHLLNITKEKMIWQIILLGLRSDALFKIIKWTIVLAFQDGDWNLSERENQSIRWTQKCYWTVISRTSRIALVRMSSCEWTVHCNQEIFVWVIGYSHICRFTFSKDTHLSFFLNTSRRRLYKHK